LADQAADRAVKRGLLELERRKGFRGPVAAIAKENIKDYAEAIHKELTEFEEPIRQSIMTPIEDSEIYKAVVSAVDPKGVATILVGHLEGTISSQDSAWTGRTPKVGDVYWVRKIPLNPPLSKGGEGGFSFTIEQEPKLESALFSFNPLSGEVKAMIGGFSFKRSEFNRATQALRQPGSAFKPIVYAAALDKGYTPKTTVIDAPVVYQVGRNKYWNPKNYSNKHNGPMSVRSALTHSINIIAVKVFHDIGIDYAVAYARKLGLASPISKYLSSALGASDLTLQELTRVYGTFPAGGIRPDLIFIRKITDKTGKVIEENEPYALDPEHVFDFVEPGPSEGLNSDLMLEEERLIKKDKLKLTEQELKILYGSAIPPGHVITPQTAFLMVDLMRDVIDHGTGFKAKALNRPSGGKTGTTNDESDAWFVGYVPDLIAGVWVGFDNRKPIGPRMTGGVVAAPIWLYYMEEVLKDKPVKDFAVPANIKLAQIDSMTGGSAIEDLKPEPEELEIPTEEAPASRGVDFLFKDLDKL
jgi:penicillin-binding protein 1A